MPIAVNDGTFKGTLMGSTSRVNTPTEAITHDFPAKAPVPNSLGSVNIREVFSLGKRDLHYTFKDPGIDRESFMKTRFFAAEAYAQAVEDLHAQLRISQMLGDITEEELEDGIVIDFSTEMDSASVWKWKLGNGHSNPDLDAIVQRYNQPIVDYVAPYLVIPTAQTGKTRTDHQWELSADGAVSLQIQTAVITYRSAINELPSAGNAPVHARKSED